jgi:ABC-type antimicrobial peptide transport system permease subunit
MLAVDDAAHADIADRLRAAPFESMSVLDRAAATRSLRTDPVAIGLIGALTLGFGAAAAFAAVGYLVSAVVAARERLGEFALLRALGTSHAETRRWLTLESGSTVLVSLGGGVGLGLGLAWIILPSVSLARDGGIAIPTPVVVIPWATIAVVTAGAAAVLFAVPAVVTRMLGRTRVAEVLRLGDEG